MGIVANPSSVTFLAGTVSRCDSGTDCAVLFCVQLVNRNKNNKKKSATPLTEDMLNELNKNHMGGLDNCGADDLYNMEDVWNDKPAKKVRLFPLSEVVTYFLIYSSMDLERSEL